MPMKSKQKSVSIVLASLMAATLMLSACSSNSGNTGNTGTVGNTGGKNGNTEQSSGEDTKPQAKQKITILSANAPGFTPNVPNWDDNIYVKKFNELSGYDVKFEFLSANDYNTQLTLRFASNELADLVYTGSIDSPAHAGAVEQGAIHDLTDIIEKYGKNLKANIPEKVWKAPEVSKNGRIYAIPALVPHPHSVVMYIREDWLKKLNMDMPKTLDDWLEYFERVKQEDMDGDGDPNNEYGFMVRENFGSSDAFFYEFGVALNHWVMQGDEFVPSVITPNMKDALAFWRKLYKNGYINPNAFTNKYADWQAGITSGKAGSWLHYVDNLTTFWSPDKFINQPDAKPVMIEPPVGPKGQGIGLANTGMYYVWIIPSSVKDPERVVQFLDKVWGDPEIKKFNSFGIEGTNYEVVNGEIKWDPEAPSNAEDSQNLLYQINTNVMGHSLNNDEHLKLSPFADELKRGFQISEKYKIEADSMYMPMLEAFNTRPELLPNFGNGDTLLIDMFARVITSDVDIDTEFDKFVKEWRSRGGDEAIKEATAWHKQYYKQ